MAEEPNELKELAAPITLERTCRNCKRTDDMADEFGDKIRWSNEANLCADCLQQLEEDAEYYNEMMKEDDVEEDEPESQEEES